MFWVILISIIIVEVIIMLIYNYKFFHHDFLNPVVDIIKVAVLLPVFLIILILIVPGLANTVISSFCDLMNGDDIKFMENVESANPIIYGVIDLIWPDIDQLVENAKRNVIREKDGLAGKRDEIMQAKAKLAIMKRQRNSLKQELDEAMNSDISKQTIRYKRLRTRFKAMDRSCQILDAAIKKGSAEIVKAAAMLEEREIELEYIVALLEAGQAMEVAKKFSTSLTDVGVSSEENCCFKEIRDQLARFNAEIEFSNVASGKPEFLDYGTSERIVTVSGVQE